MGFIAIVFLIVVLMALFTNGGVVDNYRGNNFFVDDYKDSTRNKNLLSKEEDYLLKRQKALLTVQEMSML